MQRMLYGCQTLKPTKECQKTDKKFQKGSLVACEVVPGTEDNATSSVRNSALVQKLVGPVLLSQNTSQSKHQDISDPTNNMEECQRACIISQKGKLSAGYAVPGTDDNVTSSADNSASVQNGELTVDEVVTGTEENATSSACNSVLVQKLVVPVFLSQNTSGSEQQDFSDPTNNMDECQRACIISQKGELSAGYAVPGTEDNVTSSTDNSDLVQKGELGVGEIFSGTKEKATVLPSSTERKCQQVEKSSNGAQGPRKMTSPKRKISETFSSSSTGREEEPLIKMARWSVLPNVPQHRCKICRTYVPAEKNMIKEHLTSKHDMTLKGYTKILDWGKESSLAVVAKGTPTTILTEGSVRTSAL
jgi:hypothetical protein